MVAQVQNVAGEAIAVHRTYLRPDGAGKAEITPPKASVNAGAKMHRRAGVKLHHGRWQQGAPYGAPCWVLVILRGVVR
jgi:hypothetical protein